MGTSELVGNFMKTSGNPAPLSCSSFTYICNFYLMVQNGCLNSNITTTFQPPPGGKNRERERGKSPKEWYMNWDLKNDQELAKGRMTRKNFLEEALRMSISGLSVWWVGNWEKSKEAGRWGVRRAVPERRAWTGLSSPAQALSGSGNPSSFLSLFQFLLILTAPYSCASRKWIQTITQWEKNLAWPLVHIKAHILSSSQGLLKVIYFSKTAAMPPWLQGPLCLLTVCFTVALPEVFSIVSRLLWPHSQCQREPR